MSSDLKRFGMAVIVTVEAKTAEEAWEIVAHADPMTQHDNPSTVIESDYSTNAFELPPDYESGDGRETLWEIPEVLWGDGRINYLHKDTPRTIRG